MVNICHFKDPHHGHILSADLGTVKHKLRKVIIKGEVNRETLITSSKKELP